MLDEKWEDHLKNDLLKDYKMFPSVIEIRPKS